MAGRPLILGGVPIPFDKGLSGHSDGDVLSHAVIDAVLGGAGLGDIGSHFPPGDPRFEAVDSRTLVERTRELLRGGGWQVAYVDATIVAERPLLSPFIGMIEESLAASLGLDRDAVNLKAKTSDGLGFIGRGEGIGALAVATVGPAK